MPTDNTSPFEKFFDAWDDVNELLNDGPGDDSEAFLKEIMDGVEDLHSISKTLTVEDVDREFTDDAEVDNDEEESRH